MKLWQNLDKAGNVEKNFGQSGVTFVRLGKIFVSSPKNISTLRPGHQKPFALLKLVTASARHKILKHGRYQQNALAQRRIKKE